MSQPSLQVVVAAANEMEKSTVIEKKRRTHCSQEYVGTMFSLFLTFPLLFWVFTLISRVVANAAQDHECQYLLKEDPTTEAVSAMVAVFCLLLVYFIFSFPFGNWLASLGFLLLVVVSVSVTAGFPYLEDKTTFGIFHSSDSPPLVRNNNNSEYWNNNIRKCVCRTGDCEDMVYRNYFVKINRDNVNSIEEFDSSGYTRLTSSDEPKRHRSPAQDLKGTALKKGDKGLLTDRASPRSDSRYHEVCYSKKIGDDYEGNRTLCYDCYACEEKFLIREQRKRWRLGNSLYVNTLLLIAVILIVFLAESWARYME